MEIALHLNSYIRVVKDQTHLHPGGLHISIPIPE